MRQFLVLAISALLVGCGQSTPEGVKLSGSLEQFVDGGFAYFERITENGVEPVDTLSINGDGTFAAYIDIPDPAFYRINFNGRQIITLILTGSETEVVINADGNDPRGFSEVSGSYDTEYKRQMDVMMQEYRETDSRYATGSASRTCQWRCSNFSKRTVSDDGPCQNHRRRAQKAYT